MTAPLTTSARAPRALVAMLVVAYTLNFVDRQVIGILAGPIKAELSLTDSQLGLMGGVAFAVFYGVLGIPLARLADHTTRSGVITGAIAVWSAFTALCGLAPGFWTLFLCRVGVGVGEAGGVAPSYALVADAVPSGSRARALAILSFGSPIGSALGILLGGWLAATVDWRMAFLALGAAGLLFAPLFRALVREPSRSVELRANAPALWPVLARNPTFWLLSLGAAATSLVGYGLLFWLPSFFVRSHGLSLLATSRLYGGIVLVGGMALASPRALYAFGRDGYLPRAMGAVHPTYKTPWVAVIVQLAICCTLALTSGFAALAVISNVAALLVYLGCAGAAVQLRRKGVQVPGTAPFRLPGGVLVPIIAGIAILALLTSITWGEWLVLLEVAVAATVIFFVTRRHRAAMPRPTEG